MWRAGDCPHSPPAQSLPDSIGNLTRVCGHYDLFCLAAIEPDEGRSLKAWTARIDNGQTVGPRIVTISRLFPRAITRIRI